MSAETECFENIIAFLKSSLSNQTGMSEDELEQDESFVDLGLDSINLIKLATDIERKIQTSFPPTVFLEKGSLDALGKHMLENYAESFA